MAIELGDNIQTGAPKPTDSRYLNNQVPWASCAEVNAGITDTRYTGLTVNILGSEYWYKEGILDACLIEKTSSGGGTITGGTNGLCTSGANIVLGGALTGDTTISGAHTLCLSSLTAFNATATNIGLTGAVGVTGAIDGSSTLDILGSTALHSTLAVTGTTTLAGLNTSGAIDGNSTLNVAGATALQSTLNVTGATSLSAVATYLTDLSPFTARQIPDAAWVTGNTCTGTITGGANGLSTSGTDVILGGALTGDITINLATHDLKFSGDSVQYTTDYSSTYVARSLVDAEYVTGLTSSIWTVTDGIVTLTEPTNNLELGSIAMETDGGELTFVNMCISAAASGTTESYSLSMAGEPVLTILGVSDGLSGSTGNTVIIADGLKIPALPAKSSETDILYIAADGTVASGATSGGGVGWDGTPNVGGIGTYVDANTICNEANLTFDGTILEFSNTVNRTIRMQPNSTPIYACALVISGSSQDVTTTSSPHIGGDICIFGGKGQGFCDCSSTSGGHGGNTYIFGGQGGHAFIYPSPGGQGGDLYLCGGAGGVSDAYSDGSPGNVYLRGYTISMFSTNTLTLGAFGKTGYYQGVNDVSLYYNSAVKLCTTNTGICVIGAITCSSDCRIKKNIEPISNALSMITQLCGVCFDSCIDDSASIGLIAQDVENIVPQVVDYGIPTEDMAKKYNINDCKMYGLNYGGITPLLIEAIKEQQIQITCLQQEINELKLK